MMRIIFLPILFFAVCLHAQRAFTLRGKGTNMNKGWVFLEYEVAEDKTIRDSTFVENGIFHFSGNIFEPTKARIYIANQVGDNNCLFFLEPGKLTISFEADHLSKATIKGSRSQHEYEIYKNLPSDVSKSSSTLYYEYNTMGDSLELATRNGNEPLVIKLKGRMEEIRDSIELVNKLVSKEHFRFFFKHPHSYITAYGLIYEARDMKLETLETYYNRLGLETQMSLFGKRVEKEIEKLRGGSPGTIAKNFSRIGIDGDTVRFALLRGKYVLLDFWASWCVPCRKGNPHLVELYHSYKEKGLEIIGIADNDNTPDKWRAAVDQDHLNWLHVLRGIDWEKIRRKEKNPDDLNEQFGIRTLPTKILVDKKGFIIGRYDENEDELLDRKLDELFKDGRK